MTVVDAGPRQEAPLPQRGPGWMARLWAAPLWVHVVALAIVLFALLPVIGTNAVFSPDEGAAAVEARSLADGDGWIVPHPAADLDPDEVHYPFSLSAHGAKGAAPFAKHPLYALLLAGADRVAGFAGMMVLSMLGTVVAAALAALLARRIDRSLTRATLWVVGLASPLLFDGFVVIAHPLGAAAAAAAVLLAVVALERRSAWLAFSVAPAMALAVLLRNEAVFFALGLGVVAGVLALRRRDLVALLVAGASVGAAGVAHIGERLWTQSIVGAGAPAGGSLPSGGGSLIAGRLRGFLLTWFRPGYDGSTRLTVALLAMLVALVLGAMVVRRHPRDRASIMVWSSVAAIAAVAGLLIDPSNLVPGLLVAFPLCVPGLLLLRRSSLETTAAKVAIGSFGLFAAAVIATQYEQGGSSEWGGRYFALGLPVLVPVLLLAIRDGGRRLDASLRRITAAALVVCSVALVVMGLATLRSQHRFTGRLVAAIGQGGTEAGGPDPVFVTTHPAVPRIMWESAPRQRWLFTPRDDLASVVDDLRGAGISRFVFVTRALARDEPQLTGTSEFETVYAQAGTGGWQVRVLGTS